MSIAKAYRMCYSILHDFYTNSIDFMIMLYKTYIRPLLEFNTVIWTPSYVNYIDKCERVQRYFTKRLQGMWNMSYLNRLELLHLEILEERRIYNDLICAFKLFHGLYNLNVNDFFVLAKNSTRGHAFKIVKQFCKHTFARLFFTYSITNIWNSLPDHIVCSYSLVNFKRKLHNFNVTQFCKGRAFK